jgi:hypothetical protein
LAWVRSYQVVSHIRLGPVPAGDGGYTYHWLSSGGGRVRWSSLRSRWRPRAGAELPEPLIEVRGRRVLAEDKADWRWADAGHVAGERQDTYQAAGFRVDDYRLPPPWSYESYGREAFVPYWFLTSVALAPAAWRGWRRWLGARRGRVGLCPACGYDVRGSGGRCPECGRLSQAVTTATG